MKSLLLITWEDPKSGVQKFRLINLVSSKWENFGLILNQEENLLESWKTECLGDARKCWKKVMQHWLTEQVQDNTCRHQPTWGGMLKLLDDAEFSEIANRLKTILTIKAVISFLTSPQSQNTHPT